MATKQEITKEIIETKESAQDIVRKKYLLKLSRYTGRDTILYCTAYGMHKNIQIPSGAISLIPDDIIGFMTSLKSLKNENLDLIVHSPGGTVEAVEQIVSYLRSKYKHIRIIIPQSAMSAATILACACDEIVMGKHSAIGPIDPQITIPLPNGLPFTTPAYSLISEFFLAKNDILTNPNTAPLWVPKLSSWPPGILDICNQTIELAKSKVSSWLEMYMFKSEGDAKQKSDAIAEWLSNSNNHLTHGRPISIKMAQEHGLKVISLEADNKLQDLVLSVFYASLITMEVTNTVKMIENHKGIGLYTHLS